MDASTTVAASVISFGAGVVIGRTLLAPPTAAPAPRAIPSLPSTPSGLASSEVAGALALHGAQHDFDSSAPTASDLQRDVGRHGSARFSEGQRSTLDLIRFDVARLQRAAAAVDLDALAAAVQGLTDRIQSELGVSLADDQGVPSWRSDAAR